MGPNGGLAEHNKITTIGVFAVELDDAYQSVIWRGIEYQANHLGRGVISFLGSRASYPIVSEASLNAAYNLAGSANVDGLILISSAIATLHDSVDLEELFSPWKDLPRVSVGIRIPSMSSITVEETSAVSLITRHLVETHRRRRFALVSGPLGHHESVARREAVEATLQEYGLHLDPLLVESGHFRQASGEDAVERLLARGLEFDALVCLNDRMAQGALKALARHRIGVPVDVSLTGFDGSEFSRYSSPPLTTVIQPLYEMGRSAVDALDNVLRGGEEQHVVLNCTPVIRESCGCIPRIGGVIRPTEIPSYATSGETRAVNDLVDCVHNCDQEGFIVRLNSALDSTGRESGALDRWNEYLSVVERRTGADVDNNTGFRLEGLVADARQLIGNKMARYQAARRITTEDTFAKLRLISAMLAGAFELSTMFIRLEQALSLFDIRTGFLVTFESENGESRTGSRARLLLAMDRETCPIPPTGIVFDTADILPRRFSRRWKRSNWVLTPLVFENEALGYLLLPGGFESPPLYDILQEQIASNLKATLLLEQVRTHEQTLQDEVSARTRDLRQINEELSREVERRAELEQEVIDVSNRTMERIGQDLHDDLCQHLSGIALLTSIVRNSIAQGEGGDVASLDHITDLLTDSILRVKEISRGLVPTGLEARGLAWKVESLVLETRRGTGKWIGF
ncbi:MAG: substrate-binding domain-containing protein, partial [Alkalispirochaeta sp.]